MKTFARISISLVAVVGLAGVAVAGDQPAPAPAKTPAPAKAPTATPATPATPAKPATPAPAPAADKKAAPAPAPAKAEMPKPAADIAATFKAMGGNWRCTGTAMDMGTNAEAPTKGTIKNKMDLDKWWIVTSFAETKKNGYKYTSYTSFDDKTKKWTRVMFDNMGGRELTESTGLKDNKVMWEGQSASAMGTMKSRHTEEIKGPKEVRMSGEYSMDTKTWMKAYDVTCKK